MTEKISRWFRKNRGASSPSRFRASLVADSAALANFYRDTRKASNKPASGHAPSELDDDSRRDSRGLPERFSTAAGWSRILFLMMSVRRYSVNQRRGTVTVCGRNHYDRIPIFRVAEATT